ncbi:hypothetical protein J437_LFUL013597 [Ladona fulva]|uniref:DDE Tnp4 domain-containing protein n=1 Tax=Ladona fulva TaxID=123851 RepID=A0A8K0KGG3_LADFU|nr:hypothetical protein J437_LFUL013597 [Ladona fulva]
MVESGSVSRNSDGGVLCISIRTIVPYRRIKYSQLSRGRKNIECTFGMLTQKFQAWLTPIRCRKYENIISIVNCVCILHNFIRKKDGVPYTISTAESANSRLPRNIPYI